MASLRVTCSLLVLLLLLPVVIYCQCETSLQALINSYGSGATITVPACQYRESLVITKPVTLVGSVGSELRGSDVWTAWVSFSSNGATYWRSNNAVPPVTSPVNPSCPDATTRCNWPEQVKKVKILSLIIFIWFRYSSMEMPKPKLP